MRAILTMIAFAIIPGAAHAQIQLMGPEKLAALRAAVPQLDDDEMARKISGAILYTDDEIPPAYQFQPIANGRGVDGTVFYTPSAHLNQIRSETNGNREFPWRTPGGLDFAEQVTDEFRFLWLPKRDDGRPWPVVVYRDRLEKSDAVNMPIPTGWKWLFPVGTTIGEVLVIRFSDGYQYTYEIRTRTREIDDWDVEIYRPFPTLSSFKQRLSELGKSIQGLDAVKPERVRMIDEQHAGRGFRVEADLFKLPPLPSPLARELLTTTTFRASSGQAWTAQASAPTVDAGEHIVPPRYMATFLGTDRESCANCHQHVLRHVDRFAHDEWYGYIRGSDGIFSFHPIDPSCIGPPDRQVRLRREFVEAGIVELYDADKHADTMYRAIPKFDNRPANSYPPTNRRIVGG